MSHYDALFEKIQEWLDRNNHAPEESELLKALKEYNLELERRIRRLEESIGVDPQKKRYW